MTTGISRRKYLHSFNDQNVNGRKHERVTCSIEANYECRIALYRLDLQI